MKQAFVLTLALIASGCAAMTPAPRFSAQSPADATAPEAASAAPAPALTGSGELADAPRAAASLETYTCRMHPQIAAKAPGSCPICGMTLVKKEPQEQQP